MSFLFSFRKGCGISPGWGTQCLPRHCLQVLAVIVALATLLESMGSSGTTLLADAPGPTCLFEDLELPVRQAACDGFLQMRGVSCQLPASHGKSVGAFGGLDRIRGTQEDILTSPFALARATGDAGIGAASHHPVSAGAEGRTGAARLPTATLHCRLALALVASFFVLTIPLAPKTDPSLHHNSTNLARSEVVGAGRPQSL